MEYGVFTSDLSEIAQTRYWTLYLYCNKDKSIIGAKLYNGNDENKTLAAVCERYVNKNKTVYAFEIPGGQKFTNDFDGVCKMIGSSLSCDTEDMKKVDSIEISKPYDMPTVTEKGIAVCLKQWRMGTSYRQINNGFVFQMITNTIEYVFQIQTDNCNIYCGASVNVPYDGGMFGGGQYFRLRNFADNSKPFCRFECNLGNDLTVPFVPECNYESGECTVTKQGFYWPVKRYNDDEIVLSGCGGDEYVYNRNEQKNEHFRVL